MAIKVLDIFIKEEKEKETVEQLLKTQLGRNLKGITYLPIEKVIRVRFCASLKEWETSEVLQSHGYTSQYKGMKSTGIQ